MNKQTKFVAGRGKDLGMFGHYEKELYLIFLFSMNTNTAFFLYMLLSASNESHFQVTNDVKGFVKSEAFSYLYQYMSPGRRLPALPKMLTFMLSKVECILTQVDQMILQPTGITLQGQ